MIELEDMVEPWRQHLRLTLLRFLANPEQCPGRQAHESLLTDLLPTVLVNPDRDRVRAELVWLHSKGLVVAEVAEGSIGAMLTDAGARVANGTLVVPGVKQPNRAGVAKSVAELQAALLKPIVPGG